MIIDFPENYFPLLAPAKCIYIIFDCLSAVIRQGNHYKKLLVFGLRHFVRCGLKIKPEHFVKSMTYIPYYEPRASCNKILNYQRTISEWTYISQPVEYKKNEQLTEKSLIRKPAIKDNYLWIFKTPHLLWASLRNER